MKHFRPLLLFGILLISQIALGQIEKDKNQLEVGNAYFLSLGVNTGFATGATIGFNVATKQGAILEFNVSAFGREPGNLPADYDQFHLPNVFDKHYENHIFSYEFNYGRRLNWSTKNVRFGLVGGISQNFVRRVESFEFGEYTNWVTYEKEYRYRTNTADQKNHFGLQTKLTVDFVAFKTVGLTSHVKLKAVPSEWYGATVGLGIILGKLQ